MKVYLDNCCYNRPYDDQTQILIRLETEAKLYIQEMIKSGEVNLVTSFILWYELSQNPIDMRRKGITDFIRDNSSEFINTDYKNQIRKKANEIMETGVKMKDAFHVACALSAGTDFFITTDRRLLKFQSDEIAIVDPVGFVNFVRGEKDE